MSDEFDDSNSRESGSYAHREHTNLLGHEKNARTEKLNLRTQFDASRRNGASALEVKSQAPDRATWERVRGVRKHAVSKMERDALKKTLAMPRAELNLEPNSAVRFRVEQRITIQSIRRIQVIEKRLDRVDGLAQRAFDRSR